MREASVVARRDPCQAPDYANDEGPGRRSLGPQGYWRFTAALVETAFLRSTGVMTQHKLTAGDGYTYLTRQVAAFDATERGHVGLGDYYSQRGESPGRWAGHGLPGLGGLIAGQFVGEEQMKSLFGEGRHPDADRLEQDALAGGRTPTEARAAGTLGRAFFVFSARADGFRARCAQEYAALNTARG